MKRKILLIGWNDPAKDKEFETCFESIKSRYDVLFAKDYEAVLDIVSSNYMAEEPIKSFVFSRDFIVSQKIIVKHLYNYGKASRVEFVVNVISSDNDKEAKPFVAGGHTVSLNNHKGNWTKVWVEISEIIESNIN